MSLFAPKRTRSQGDFFGQTPAGLVSGRRSDRMGGSGDPLARSSVWAARRLRADLVSAMPIGVMRSTGGLQVSVTAPKVLVTPSDFGPGQPQTMAEWLWASQWDLDSDGNAYGLITHRDGNGLPSRVELVGANAVTVKGKGSRITDYYVGRERVDPQDMWHERQYAPAGSAVGLSPLVFAAGVISGALAADAFAETAYGQSSFPGSHLKNTSQTLSAEEARKIKDRFKESSVSGDVFVSGNDWEFKPLQFKPVEAAFIEYLQAKDVDVARYLGVPANSIDAAVHGSAVTYANVNQRGLDLLVQHLGPTIRRREDALSQWVPQPRYVRLDVDAGLMRLDPVAQGTLLVTEVEGRILAPSEARAKLGYGPYTAEQIAEFDLLQVSLPSNSLIKPKG